MSWTDERVAKLSKLWADGLSASQIATELGGVTRNAVIGKVHRLGLSGRAKPVSTNTKRPKRPASKAKPFNGMTKPAVNANGINGHSHESRIIIEDMKPPVSKNLELASLCERSCKWPQGDPATEDFGFCGNARKEDAPYCEYHCRVAYQQPVDRRREKRAVNA